MAFSNTIFVVLPLLLLLTLANKVVSQDTTSFTYDSFPTSGDKLIYQGDAFVPPSSTSFVRLTKANAAGTPAKESIGRVVYSPLVYLWKKGMQASFETTIKFLITAGDSPNPGDTISFFIAPANSPIPPGSTDRSLGLVDPTTGLAPSLFAVEFDIAPNPWDPKYPHIGININSRVSKNVSRFENAVGEEVTARINYVSNTRTITVVATYGSETSTVRYKFSLKKILPKQVQVGISATTGSWVAFFDLKAWYFSSTLVLEGNNPDKTCIRQNEILKSEGIRVLISSDENHLLGMALREKLDDLNKVASVVSRLGKKCTISVLRGFEHVYGDIVSGFVDIKELSFLVKDMDSMIRKIERYVNSTASLYNEMEVMDELELATKKFQHEESRKAFEQKLSWQKQDVRHLKDLSLWNQTYDKIVELLARTVCTVYARMCVVFGDACLFSINGKSLQLDSGMKLEGVEKKNEGDSFRLGDYNPVCLWGEGGCSRSV